MCSRGVSLTSLGEKAEIARSNCTQIAVGVRTVLQDHPEYASVDPRIPMLEARIATLETLLGASGTTFYNDVDTMIANAFNAFTAANDTIENSVGPETLNVGFMVMRDNVKRAAPGTTQLSIQAATRATEKIIGTVVIKTNGVRVIAALDAKGKADAAQAAAALDAKVKADAAEAAAALDAQVKADAAQAAAALDAKVKADAAQAAAALDAKVKADAVRMVADSTQSLVVATLDAVDQIVTAQVKTVQDLNTKVKDIGNQLPQFIQAQASEATSQSNALNAILFANDSQGFDPPSIISASINAGQFTSQELPVDIEFRDLNTSPAVMYKLYIYAAGIVSELASLSASSGMNPDQRLGFENYKVGSFSIQQSILPYNTAVKFYIQAVNAGDARSRQVFTQSFFRYTPIKVPVAVNWQHGAFGDVVLRWTYDDVGSSATGFNILSYGPNDANGSESLLGEVSKSSGPYNFASSAMTTGVPLKFKIRAFRQERVLPDSSIDFSTQKVYLNVQAAGVDKIQALDSNASGETWFCKGFTTPIGFAQGPVGTLTWSAPFYSRFKQYLLTYQETDNTSAPLMTLTPGLTTSGAANIFVSDTIRQPLNENDPQNPLVHGTQDVFTLPMTGLKASTAYNFNLRQYNASERKYGSALTLSMTTGAPAL